MNAQRRLGQNTQGLQTTFTRLASGLRINKPSDDAAGLAVAASLTNDSRVYGQAVRNVNDAISLHNIAEGAMSELSNVLTRIAELAEQSSNGVLSAVQRRSLDAEGQALRKEYNRIVRSVEFNGLKLIDGSLTNLSIQTGYDSIMLGIDPNTNLVNDGTFGINGTYAAGAGLFSIEAGDVNNDGFSDLLEVDSGGAIYTRLGNGDGTFRRTITAQTASSMRNATIGDVNGDGFGDVVVTGQLSSAQVLLSNGDGSFKAVITVGMGSGSNQRETRLADFNGDGRIDIISRGIGAGTTVSVALGNGNGTFAAGVTYHAGIGNERVSIGDFNGDNILDFVVDGGANHAVYVGLGNSNGSFRAPTSYAAGTTVQAVHVDDFNDDGIADIAALATGDDVISILLGNGNGTFRARTSIAIGGFTNDFEVQDFNGDGIGDFAVTNAAVPQRIDILLSNGDGTYFFGGTVSTTGDAFRLALSDFNEDGVVDIAAVDSDNNIGRVYLGNGENGALLKRFDLSSQDGALEALDQVKRSVNSLAISMGILGANQGRLQSAASSILVGKENFTAAASRILDADVAEESAHLVKYNILQQASAAVLSQANQLPALVIKLLQG